MNSELGIPYLDRDTVRSVELNVVISSFSERDIELFWEYQGRIEQAEGISARAQRVIEDASAELEYNASAARRAVEGWDFSIAWERQERDRSWRCTDVLNRLRVSFWTPPNPNDPIWTRWLRDYRLAIPEHPTIELMLKNKFDFQQRLAQEELLLKTRLNAIRNEQTLVSNESRGEVIDYATRLMLFTEWTAASNIGTAAEYVKVLPERAPSIARVYADRNAASPEAFSFYWRGFIKYHQDRFSYLPNRGRTMDSISYSFIEDAVLKVKWEEWVAYNFLYECYEIDAIPEPSLPQ